MKNMSLSSLEEKGLLFLLALYVSLYEHFLQIFRIQARVEHH